MCPSHRLRSGRELYRNRPKLSRPFLLFFPTSPPTHLPPEGHCFGDCGRTKSPPLAGDCLGKRQKQGPPLGEAGPFNKFRRRPTFPHSNPCSIIGAVGLNFCVRDGNRCDPYAIATENRTTGFQLPKTFSIRLVRTLSFVRSIAFYMEGVGARRSSPRLSHEKLFMVKPHGQLVPVS